MKHLTSDALPLHVCTTAPTELCDLVHAMLDKRASRRPMAVDVRTRAEQIAQDQQDQAPEAIAIARTRTIDGRMAIDYEELEFGVTELLPTMRKPRWTPQLEPLKAITPKHIIDQVSGEIVARRR